MKVCTSCGHQHACINISLVLAHLKPGDRLKSLRKTNGITQAQLARLAKMARANIAAIEAGHRGIGVKVAMALGKAFGCDYRELL